MSKRTNASIMSDLMDLKATGAMGIIEDAFKAGCIDETVAGDIEDVRIALGLQTGRTTPTPAAAERNTRSAVGNRAGTIFIVAPIFYRKGHKASVSRISLRL